SGAGKSRAWSERRTACRRTMCSTAARSRVCCSTAPIPLYCSMRSAAASNFAWHCPRPGGSPISRSASACSSASTRSGRSASPAAAPAPTRRRLMPEPFPRRPWQRRLMLAWLLLLIVLPHIDLALLSLRERIAPRVYRPSLSQYRTFFVEPLYWQVFVRTAILSAVGTAPTLSVAFPVAWVITKVARGRTGALLFVLCLIPFWVSETVR